MAEKDENSNVLARLARLVGVTPHALVAVAAKAEQAPPLDLMARRRTLADRCRALAEAGEEAARTLADRLRPIEERATDLRSQLAQVRKGLAETAVETFDAEAKYAAESNAREREAQTIEAQLRESADPRLALFIEKLQGEIDALRVQGPTVYQSGPHPLTDARKTFSNYPTLLLRLDALRQAIAAVEAMKLEALDGEAIETRLDALRAALPEIEVRVAVA
jgi:hypothetical protein